MFHNTADGLNVQGNVQKPADEEDRPDCCQPDAPSVSGRTQSCRYWRTSDETTSTTAHISSDLVPQRAGKVGAAASHENRTAVERTKASSRTPKTRAAATVAPVRATGINVTGALLTRP